MNTCAIFFAISQISAPTFTITDSNFTTIFLSDITTSSTMPNVTSTMPNATSTMPNAPSTMPNATSTITTNFISVGSCIGTEFGCCKNTIIQCLDKNCSNCLLNINHFGGCISTEYGCCNNTEIQCIDRNCSNCFLYKIVKSIRM